VNLGKSKAPHLIKLSITDDSLFLNPPVYKNRAAIEISPSFPFQKNAVNGASRHSSPPPSQTEFDFNHGEILMALIHVWR